MKNTALPYAGPGKNSDFGSILRKRVNNYFKSTEKNARDHPQTTFKLTFLIIFGIASLVLIRTGLNNLTVGWFIVFLLLGFGFPAIGFNAMHDANHESLSSKKWINTFFSYSLEIMGCSSFFWRIKHNQMHHGNTNIENHEEDFIIPGIRVSATTPLRWYHKYQHIYIFFMYPVLYLFWVQYTDYRKYFSGKIGTITLTKEQRMKLSDHIVFWTAKILHNAVLLAWPIYEIGPIAIVFYFMFCMICGSVIAIVFQLAHMVENIPIYTEEDFSKISNDWVIHEITTTSDFATNQKKLFNRILSFYVGGLNFQVEHHIFSRINHGYYPKIQKIVKDCCNEFNVKYNEHKTFWQAIISHIRYLRRCGTVETL